MESSIGGGMGTEISRKSFIRSYWNYFIELEEQLLSTKRFVDFEKTNNKTFSIEYLKLLQATCSEIDVVAKIIAEYCSPEFKSIDNKNMQKWGLVIQNTFPDIGSIKVRFNNDYEITPWSNWKYEIYQDKNNRTRYRLISGCETPYWWIAYNKVKHERTSQYRDGQTNYMRANLENLISAMSALFILEKLFLDELKTPLDDYIKSKLFTL